MAEKETLNVYQRLLKVQQEAVAPRNVEGRFGKARSAEKILEAYKPICNKHGLYLMTSDVIHTEGDRNYILATAIVVNVDVPTEQVHSSAEAWEGNVVSGLDTSQVSGKTSSYAKKYALQNLFAIDDTKDADVEHKEPEEKKEDWPSTSERELSRAKVWINKELEKQGYDTAVAKQAFINSTIKKDTISTQKDADEVTAALENLKEDEV
jgi:hypothetical protein